MKIKVIENFFDLQLHEQKLIGDEYEVKKERADELVEKKLVQLVEENGKKTNRKATPKSKTL